MPAISAIAPGKAILFGEHAVVYNQPAIAVPVHQVHVKTSVFANPKGKPDEVWIESQAIAMKSWLNQLPDNNALVILIEKYKASQGFQYLPAMRISIHSTIPVAGGLGSGAAVSVSVLRAISAFMGHPLPDEQVSALAYEVEKRHHGTPSGIDNSVITYGQPVYFQRERPIEVIHLGAAFTLVIADSGIKCPTSTAVAGVRQRWLQQPEKYDAYFTRIGCISEQAKALIESGQINALGPLMIENHQLLREIGVSLPQLDLLVTSAINAGALGAKLCGGGLGGNMLALVKPETAEDVSRALLGAGAVRTIITQVEPAR